MNNLKKEYEKFEKWLNNILEYDFPNTINAFNFNIYEGSENTYDIQLIGSDEFEEDNDEWTCSEIYSSKDDICYIDRVLEIQEWTQGLEFIKVLVKKYLESGQHKNKLLSVDAVGIGFVDGDIEIISSQ